MVVIQSIIDLFSQLFFFYFTDEFIIKDIIRLTYLLIFFFTLFF